MNTNKVQAISELIAKNQRVFKIPVYQRNYDWGTGQCKKLFDDILKVYDNEKKHFLGTFVYIKGKIDNSNLTEVLVIDGQQRLTTLYLLLKALLDCSKEQNKLHISSEIEEYVLSEIENQKKEKLDISNLTIEHILPQKQTPIWKKEVGEEYERVYGTYLHTLGNLTISGYNSELGTKSFSEKKELIKQHSKANILNEDVLSASVWNEEAIKNRANRLADIVCRLFDYKRIVLEEHSKEEFFNVDQCDSYVNTKPYKFIFLGKEVEVSYYTEMLNSFLHLLYDNQPELLEKLAKQEYRVTSSDKIYLSYDSSTMRKPQKIENTDIFYESNLSAEYIMMFIKSLLMDSPYDIDEFLFGMKYISD